MLYLVYSAAYLGHDMLAVNCELVMLLPLAWAIVFVRDANDVWRTWRVFAAGLLIGVGSLIKYQGALWLPAVAFVIGREGWSTNRRAVAWSLGALAAGFFLPLLATDAIFAGLGGLEGFLYWNVTYNELYVINPTTAGQILWRATTRLLPFLAATAVLWFGCVRSLGPSAPRYRSRLIYGLIAASLAAGFLGFRFFPHYFEQLYVPLAIGAASWVTDLLEWPLVPAGWFVAGYTTLTLGGFTVANAETFLRPSAMYQETRPVYSRVASRLRADACYGGTLFVWGYAPSFYYYSGLPVASRLFFPEFPLVNYFPGNRPATTGLIHEHMPGRHRQWKMLMGDLRRNHPTYILDTAPSGLFDWQSFPLRDYPSLQKFVRNGYESIGSVDGVEIYRRQGCGDPQLIAR
jgi:hypothetical protein